jgi:putative ABC transport system permease protein
LILVVMSRTSFAKPLPVSYESRIAKIRGVKEVMRVWWFDARYRNEDNVVPAIACAPNKLLLFASDWRMPEDQRQAFATEKDALIAGRNVASKYGWKIGDHIHLNSPNYFLDMPLDLVLRGIYTSSFDETMMAFHWSYLNEAIGRPDTAGSFWVLTQSAEDIPRLMQDIDAMFRNSPVETRTQTSKQVTLNFLSWLGNVKRILLLVSGAVVFMVLLIVANTMAMSVRERTAEIAILQALGFRRALVLAMLTAEAVAISVSGAALGCLSAAALCEQMQGYHIGGAVPAHIQVDAPTVGLMSVVAIGISLGSTLIPAYHASQLNIARALRFAE